jgi:hypothetical protein
LAPSRALAADSENIIWQGVPGVGTESQPNVIQRLESYLLVDPQMSRQPEGVVPSQKKMGHQRLFGKLRDVERV